MRGAVGLRVLELGRRLGTSAAGLSLVALGADVAQLRLGGEQLDEGERSYYHRGRRQLPDVRDLRELGQLADVVLTDLDETELRSLGVPADTPDLRGGPSPQILVSIRSFGRSGRRTGFRMTDLTEWAAGGLAGVTRRRGQRDPARAVPVVPPGRQPQALAGIAAVAGLFAALRWARARKEPVVVDLSVQEVVASTLHSIVPNFVWNEQILGHPSSPTSAIGMLLPASDGDVYIRTVEAHQWTNLMTWMGDPDWADLGATPDDRLANSDALQLLVAEWTVQWSRADLVAEGQRRRVPIALPRSLTDVLAWEHLRARGVWSRVDVDGSATDAPRLPLLEPAAWPASVAVTGSDVAVSWSGR